MGDHCLGCLAQICGGVGVGVAILIGRSPIGSDRIGSYKTLSLCVYVCVRFALRIMRQNNSSSCCKIAWVFNTITMVGAVMMIDDTLVRLCLLYFQSIDQSINRSIDQFVCLSVCFFSLIARGCQPSIPSPSARPDGAACACPGDLLRCCRGCLDPVSRGGGDLERGLQGRGEDDRGDIDQQLCATDDLHGSAHSAADGVRIGVCVCVCGLLRLQTRRRTSKQRDDAS